MQPKGSAYASRTPLITCDVSLLCGILKQVWAALVTQTKCPPLVTATPLHTSGEENKKWKEWGIKMWMRRKRRKKKA